MNQTPAALPSWMDQREIDCSRREARSDAILIIGFFSFLAAVTLATTFYWAGTQDASQHSPMCVTPASVQAWSSSVEPRK